MQLFNGEYLKAGSIFSQFLVLITSHSQENQYDLELSVTYI